MKFTHQAITDLLDATQNFEQLQVGGIFTDTVLGGDLKGTLPNPTLKPLTGSAWHAPTLINSWVNVGTGFETAGYLKDPLGFVHLKGAVKTGTSATVAFVLPAGFRPGATTLNAAVAAGTTVAAVEVDTSGNVAVFYTASSSTGLSGITFLAEN